MNAYRCYHLVAGVSGSRRLRSEIVNGEAALERVLARQTKRVIWFEGALNDHQCQVCGRSGQWAKGWISWARWGERHAARGEGDDIYCSLDCAKIENPKVAPPHWVVLDEEPRPIEARRALWRAVRAADEARSAARKAVRGVPMPVWPGDGFCKWCTKPVEPPRRSWHQECYREYSVYVDPGCAASFLRKRDGPLCQWPGCKERGTDVDHRVPLWKVAHLPDDLRRPYFGPENIWLLCPRHHKRKTALEAKERADLKRAKAQLMAGAAQPGLFPS